MMKDKDLKAIKKQMQRTRPRMLDTIMHAAHDEAFERIDCLDCANCCKTTSPTFTDKDVERIAGKLKLSQHEFITTYLRTDEDGDAVLQTAPCPFLAADHTCDIYDYRPKACREYPHTDRVKQFQLIDLTLRNASVCPAVEDILQQIDKS